MWDEDVCLIVFVLRAILHERRVAMQYQKPSVTIYDEELVRKIEAFASSCKCAKQGARA